MPYVNVQDRRDAHKKIRERNRAYVIEYLTKNPCIACGENDVRVLEFDHIEPSTKKHNVGRMVASQHHSLAAIQKEIDKCQVLCANCHRRKTHEERGIYWSTF